MEKMVKVTFRGKVTKEFPADATLAEVARSFQKYFNYPILAAKLDNVVVNLNREIEKKCDVDFFDRSSTEGNTVYTASANFMLIVAIHRLFGPGVDVTIEHSIDRGVYCELIGKKLDKTVLKKIEDEMHKLVEEDLAFTRLSVSRLDAIKYFKKEKRMDKVNVLRYISNSYVNLYRLDDFYDYFFTELASSTKDIDSFKLTYIKDNGFQLAYPSVSSPECTFDYVHHKMIFDKFLDYTRWGDKINVNCAADLNQIVSHGKYNEIIRLAEANFENQLATVSNAINQNRKRVKLVLIAGPSSSGKQQLLKN